MSNRQKAWNTNRVYNQGVYNLKKLSLQTELMFIFVMLILKIENTRKKWKRVFFVVSENRSLNPLRSFQKSAERNLSNRTRTDTFLTAIKKAFHIINLASIIHHLDNDVPRDRRHFTVYINPYRSHGQAINKHANEGQHNISLMQLTKNIVVDPTHMSLITADRRMKTPAPLQTPCARHISLAPTTRHLPWDSRESSTERNSCRKRPTPPIPRVSGAWSNEHVSRRNGDEA